MNNGQEQQGHRFNYYISGDLWRRFIEHMEEKAKKAAKLGLPVSKAGEISMALDKYLRSHGK